MSVFKSAPNTLHDPLAGYVPHGLPYEAALALRQRDPAAYRARAMASMAVHVARAFGLPM